MRKLLTASALLGVLTLLSSCTGLQFVDQSCGPMTSARQFATCVQSIVSQGCSFVASISDLIILVTQSQGASAVALANAVCTAAHAQASHPGAFRGAQRTGAGRSVAVNVNGVLVHGYVR